MRIGLISKFFLTGILLLGVSACAPGPGMDSDSAGENQGLTGFKNDRGVPYTIGGDTRIIDAHKQTASEPQSEPQAEPTPSQTPKPAPAAPSAPVARPRASRSEPKPSTPAPSHVPPSGRPAPKMTDNDVKLSQRITDVKIRRIDTNKKLDRFGSAAVRAQLVLGGQVHSFEGPLSPAGANRFQTAVLKSSSAANFQATAEFTDEPTQRYMAGKVTITELDERGRPMAKAEVYVRSYAAAVVTTPALDVNLFPPNRCTVDLLRDRSFAWVTNQVVDGGRSFYDIQIIAAANKSTKTNSCPAQTDRVAAGHRFFSFAGESLRTGDYAETEAKRLEAGIVKPVRVVLKGDAETQDERTFIAILEGFQGQQIDIALKVLKPDLDQLPVNKQLRGLSENAYFQIRYNDPKYAEVKAMIDDFERNYELPGVKAAIAKFVNNPQPLQTALSNAHPFRQIISDIFQYFQIAPPASLVLMIESAFFTGGKYELQTNAISTASGPFQILAGTANALGMRMFQNSAGRLPPASDERLFFVPAACGAAKHFRNSLEHFSRHDRTLAILAYYQGDGAAAGFMAKLVPRENKTGNAFKDISRYRFTYRDIERQHMISADVRGYVNRALALYFITGNPVLHKFQWKEEPNISLPPGKVIPKISMKDPECRQAVAPLIQSGVIKP